MKKLILTLGLGLGISVLAIATGQAADAKALYAKCQGCHGADGSKVALGVGKPLKGLKAAEVAKALEGYKAKTFGDKKKAIMEAQAAQMSEEDIQVLAQFISKF
jgi:cytochrome c